MIDNVDICFTNSDRLHDPTPPNYNSLLLAFIIVPLLDLLLIPMKSLTTYFSLHNSCWNCCEAGSFLTDTLVKSFHSRTLHYSTIYNELTNCKICSTELTREAMRSEITFFSYFINCNINFNNVFVELNFFPSFLA
jgi:hypothetical protein